MIETDPLLPLILQDRPLQSNIRSRALMIASVAMAARRSHDQRHAAIEDIAAKHIAWAQAEILARHGRGDVVALIEADTPQQISDGETLAK